MKMSKMIAVCVLMAGSTAWGVVNAPTDLGGLRLWLDANDIDGDGLSEGAGETYTTTWVDKSTSGNHFTTGAAPSQVLGGLNGKDVLNFNGSTQFFSGPAVLTANDDDYTYIAVFRPSAGGGVHSVYEQAGPGGGARSAILQVGGSYGFNGESNDLHNLIPIKATVWRSADLEVDNSGSPNIQIIENGVTFTGTTNGAGPAGLSVGTSGSTVGRKQQVNSEFMAGDIAEIIVYDRLLTPTEHSDVATYLNAKWALAGINSLAHRWSFDDGTADDSVGSADGALINGASVAGGKLVLDGINDYVRTTPIDAGVAAKTLVAWVQLDNLSQRSGSVLTLENPTGTDEFDGIIYGERTAGQWMNGSNFFSRSDGADNGGAIEGSLGEIMMAIAYDPDGTIRIYREGSLYATYLASGPVTYPGGVADVLMGLRHSDIAGGSGSALGNDQFWAGMINEARVYRSALSGEDIAALFRFGPNQTGLESAIPEPGTAAMGLIALALLPIRRRRRYHQSQA